MNTSTLPSRIGLGETERFLKIDPSAILERREHPVRSMFGTILAPAPDRVAEREEKLRTVGLFRLMRAERKAIPLEAAGMFYPEMTGDELKLWQKFLPSEYTLSDYEYDSITDEALEQIAIAQQLGYFDKIVIWTPEGNNFVGRTLRQAMKVDAALEEVSQILSDSIERRRNERARSWESRPFSFLNLDSMVDPLAVGIIADHNGEEHLFPIVRWGESELMSKDEIAAYVKKVDTQVTGAILATIGAITVPIMMVAHAVTKKRKR